jgi:hypothetical protein
MRTARAEVARVVVASIVGGAFLSSVAFFAYFSYSRATGSSPFVSQPAQLMTVDFPSAILPQSMPLTLFTQGFTTRNAGTIQVTSLFTVSHNQCSQGAIECKLLLDGTEISTTKIQQLYGGNPTNYLQGLTVTSPVSAGRHALSLECAGFLPDQTDAIVIRSRGTSMIIVS